MKPTQIILNLESVAKAGSVRCIGVSESYQYENGTRTDKPAGTAYECLAEKNGYEKFSVKVSDLNAVLTQEQLNEAKEPIYITFTDFIGKFYFSERTKNWELSCKASKVQIVKSSQPQQTPKL